MGSHRVFDAGAGSDHCSPSLPCSSRSRSWLLPVFAAIRKSNRDAAPRGAGLPHISEEKRRRARGLRGAAFGRNQSHIAFLNAESRSAQRFAEEHRDDPFSCVGLTTSSLSARLGVLGSSALGLPLTLPSLFPLPLIANHLWKPPHEFLAQKTRF